MGELTVRINELSVTITSLNNDKRRLEGDLANLQAELEEALNARRAAEDRADRSQMELNRLVEELRQVRRVTDFMLDSRRLSFLPRRAAVYVVALCMSVSLRHKSRFYQKLETLQDRDVGTTNHYTR